MKKIINSFIKIAALSLCLFLSTKAFGANITYNVATGDWTDANWTPQAPVAGDNIIIPAGAVVTVSSDLSATKFNCISVLGELTIESGGLLSIQQTINVNPLVKVAGGSIRNNGVFSIKQTLANSNAAIDLTNGTDADSKLSTSGNLIIDMMASTISSSSTRCIYLSQTTVTRVPRITLGGTMNFSVPAGTRFFELGNGSNAVIDGNAVFGSVSDYKNWRFIHMGNGGTLTLAGTIEFYSGYISGNGVISQSVTGTGSAVGSIVNSGNLTIHSSSISTSYAIYLNAQRGGTSPNYTYGTAKFKNTGTITLDGNYTPSYGVIYINGNPGAINEFTNESTGVLSVTNSSSTPAISCQIANVITSTILNYGIMNLNTAGTKAIVMGDANSTLTNTGTINVNKSVTGYVSNATAALVNNKTDGIFNFNVLDNTATAIDASNKIIFTNNGGTVTGRGVIGAGTYVPSTGTIAPGGNGVGLFTFSDASLVLTGKLMMNVNGTATAGTDFDQVNSTGTLDISGATLELSSGYSPANLDQVALVMAGTLTGTFSYVSAPLKWVSNYTSTAANMLYDTSTRISTLNELNGKVYVNGHDLVIERNGNGTVQLNILDMTGRNVLSTPINGQKAIINSSMLKGLYIVRLTSSIVNFTQKVSF